MVRPVIASVVLALVARGALAAPPATPTKPVTDTYHGVSVVDPYRWLEDWDDPAVKAWSESQNAHARAYLDAMPNVEGIRARLTTLLSAASVSYTNLKVVKGRTFAIKHEPAKQQPMIVVMPSVKEAGRERILVDPNALDPTGLTTIDWFVPSPDGRLLAVSMSKGGSESGDLHLFRTDTGERTGEVIPRVHGGTAGGSLAWLRNSTGFLYTRYPREGERAAEDADFYVQVYSHTLGTDPAQDRYEVGKEFPKIAEIVLEVSEDGSYALASVQKGDGGEFIHFLRGPVQVEGGGGGGGAGGGGGGGGEQQRWTQITRYEDRIVAATFGGGGGGEACLYLVSRKDAPRGKVLRAEVEMGRMMPASEIIPQHERWSIHTSFFETTGVTPAAGALYVEYMAGGPSYVRAYDARGVAIESARDFWGNPAQPSTALNEIVDAGDHVLLCREGYLEPAEWFTHKPGDAAVTLTGLKETSPARLEGVVTERVWVTSADGTQVPMTIMRRADAPKDGTVPTILWGYGGYGVSETPKFSPRRALWLEQGGTFAVANIRGGGEFGDEWHRAGNLTNKQNVFDDFAAAARHLIDQRYTSREKLALMGGSNGGLLMGATFTQNPDLCKAVVSSVGIYDMLRVERSANGAFNITEFGTVADSAQFRALYAYSPYHHVKDGTKYPAILMPTGANDPRVDPMQSRKMIARLQAADPNGLFLLRTSANAGHGIGSSLAQRIEEYTDVYGFLFTQLGLAFRPVTGAGGANGPQQPVK